MHYSRDISKPPFTSPEMAKAASTVGLLPVDIVCTDPAEKPAHDGAVAMVAYTHAVPRLGEHIILEDGRVCKVMQVFWKTRSTCDAQGKIELIALHPMVMANLIEERLGPHHAAPPP